MGIHILCDGRGKGPRPPVRWRNHATNGGTGVESSPCSQRNRLVPTVQDTVGSESRHFGGDRLCVLENARPVGRAVPRVVEAKRGRHLWEIDRSLPGDWDHQISAARLCFQECALSRPTSRLSPDPVRRYCLSGFCRICNQEPLEREEQRIQTRAQPSGQGRYAGYSGIPGSPPSAPPGGALEYCPVIAFAASSRPGSSVSRVTFSSSSSRTIESLCLFGTSNTK